MNGPQNSSWDGNRHTCLCMVEENGEVALTGVMRCAKTGTVETTEDHEFFLP